jgi:glycosidase
MWLYPTVNFFAPGVDGFGVREFRRAQDGWRKAYPAACVPVQQNLLDSHDTGRVLSMLENLRTPVRDFDGYFTCSRAKERPEFRTGKPGAAAFQALRQALIFQMTFVGAPMLYYGTEVGLWGGNDPCDRQAMLWDDVIYEDEQAGPLGKVPRRARKPDQKLLAFTQKAIALRHAEPALRRGELRWLTTGHDRLLGFERVMDGRRITVLLNASDERLAWTHRRATRDLWTNRACAAGPVEVAPRAWRILAG